MSRGESVRDTALVLSRHVAAIGLRTGSQERLRELAQFATVPVINMLSPDGHPCQVLADLLTLRQHYGHVEGLRLAYIGDGNNVARSLAVLGSLAGVEVAIASPAELSLPDDLQLPAAARAQVRARATTRFEAVAGAHAVYTDVWVNCMGDEDAAARRREPSSRRLPPRRRAARSRGAGRDRAAPPAGPRPARRSRRRFCTRIAPARSSIRQRIAGTRRRRCWRLLLSSAALPWDGATQ